MVRSTICEVYLDKYLQSVYLTTMFESMDLISKVVPLKELTLQLDCESG